MLAAVVTTLLPKDEIPDLPGGAAGPSMVLPAAIGGATLSAGQGEEVPPTYPMVASGLATGPAPTPSCSAGSAGARPRDTVLRGARTAPVRANCGEDRDQVLATYHLGVPGA
jgi:hypothetical protein